MFAVILVIFFRETENGITLHWIDSALRDHEQLTNISACSVSATFGNGWSGSRVP